MPIPTPFPTVGNVSFLKSFVLPTVYRSLSLFSHPRLRSVCPITRGKPPSHFAHAKDGFTHGLKDMSFMAGAPLRGRERGSEDLRDFLPSLAVSLRPKPLSGRGHVPSANLQDFRPPNERANVCCRSSEDSGQTADHRLFSHTGLTGSPANRLAN